MKITKTVLQKYVQGFCTKEEKEAVLHWLEFHKEEKSSLSVEELAKVKLEMWSNLSQSITKNNKPIFLYSRPMASLAVAASLIVTIFISGVSKINSNNSTAIGQLEIASGNGIIVSVDASKKPLKICFDGYIQFANKSTVTTTITYGDKDIKTFHLISGKTYYMWKFKGIPYIFNEDDLPLNEDPSRHLRGNFSIDSNEA